MNKAILFCAVFALFVLNISALDITTTDGTVYKNAKVTNILPDAIGFMYTKKNGVLAVRDLKINLLTKDLQKKFKYSPIKAANFKAQVDKFQAARAKLAQKHHKEELRLFREQKKTSKELDHIKALLHAHRVKCFVHIVRPIGQNCLGKIDMHRSTSKYGRLGIAYIRNLTGPQDELITATIYPTGKTRSFQEGMFPVYDADINKYALQILKEHENSSSGNSPVVPSKGMVFPENAQKRKKK
jgi:hypothetical protein